MIFITVGTQPNGFERCLREVENLINKFQLKDEIIAQIGHTNFETSKFKTIRFTGEVEYEELISKADIVITHAGSGAIFKSIAHGKRIIAMARLHEYNEMVDNHQLELVEKLAKDGYIIDGSYSLIKAWEILENFVPRKNDFKCTIPSVLERYIDDWIN